MFTIYQYFHEQTLFSVFLKVSITNHTHYLKGKFSSGREGALASKLNYDLK